MRIIPFTVLFLAFNLSAQTGTSLQGSGPSMTQETYPHSGSTRNRADVNGGGDIPVTKSSDYTSTRKQMNTAPTGLPEEVEQTEKSRNILKSEKDFATGPYKDGEYQRPVGEKKQAEEEKLKVDEEEEEETRVNQMDLDEF